MTLRLGCIADDLTGATDVALMLQSAGMRTIQAIGVPEDAAPQDADAVVVALKSRTIAPVEAVAQSLAALAWLRAQGTGQVLFKYCSTFDSTDAGNIGPVADALLDALGTGFTVACPAFPTNKRTIYQGHLFVGEQLLSDSPMKRPSADADARRQPGARARRQTKRKVGLVALPTVRQGTDALREAFEALKRSGHAYAIVDAVATRICWRWAPPARNCRCSPAARASRWACRRTSWVPQSALPKLMPAVGGQSAVLPGSCSAATNAQVAHWRRSQSGVSRRPAAPCRGRGSSPRPRSPGRRPRCRRAGAGLRDAEPASVREAQTGWASQRAGELVEHCLAQVARGLVAQGVRRLVVAGGETSGAVVNALGVRALRIGPADRPRRALDLVCRRAAARAGAQIG